MLTTFLESPFPNNIVINSYCKAREVPAVPVGTYGWEIFFQSCWCIYFSGNTNVYIYIISISMFLSKLLMLGKINIFIQ